MAFDSRLVLGSVCVISTSACFTTPVDEPTTTIMLSGPAMSTGEVTVSDTEQAEGTATVGATSGATSMATEGEDETGLDCTADDPPVVLAPTDPIMLMMGDVSVSFDLDFDREVTIEAGGLLVDGGASISAPMLPSMGASFGVTVDDLDPSSAYTVTVDAASVTDSCGRAMASDVSVQLVGDCSSNTPPASTTVEFHQVPGATGDTYEVTFSEVVTLEAGAISVVSGPGTIDSITPALPAASDTFTVELSGLGGITQLTVDAALVSDGCGAALDQSFDLWVCTVSSMQYGYTGAPEQFVVPGCAQGMVTLDVFGAQGTAATGGGSGGLGGQATGSLAVMTGELLEITVGGQDGYNGGAGGGGGDPVPAGTGGGASDVRLGGNTLMDRVIVGGGGGGGGAPPQGSCAAGVGGSGGTAGGTNGTSGTAGTGCGGTQNTGGSGGTQASGGTGGVPGSNCSNTPANGGAGSLGFGGNGSDGVIGCSGFTGGGGGGGGGGYYGGGGGAGGPGGGGGSWGGGGGGGGSSYTGGVVGGSTNAGVQVGDGSVTVSW